MYDIRYFLSPSLSEFNRKASILEEQRKLGARYEALSQQRSKEQDTMSMEEQQKKEAELAAIQEKLKENTRKLSRNLKETPNESNNWKKIQTERAEIQNVLSNCLREMQNGLLPQSKYKHMKNPQFNYPNSPSTQQRLEVSYELFFKKVKEEIKDRQMLQAIQEQEVMLNRIVKSLQNEVKKEKDLKKYEIEERNQKVNELVNQLRELKELTQEAKMKSEATDDAEFQCRRRLEQIELRELEQELLEEEMKLKIEEKVYNQTKEFLEKRNATLRQTGSEWKNKSDKEIEEMRQKLSYWEGIREDQISLKMKMEEDYVRETEEMAVRAHVKQARIEQERQDRENEVYDSANRIKLCYRAYKARLRFEEIKKEKALKKKMLAEEKAKKKK